MFEVPHGAVSTEQEALDLIRRAPVLVYRVHVDDTKVGVRVITPESTLDKYSDRFRLRFFKPGDERPFFYGDVLLQSRDKTPPFARAFLFTNYWHAWAYLQKLMQNRI